MMKDKINFTSLSSIAKELEVSLDEVMDLLDSIEVNYYQIVILNGMEVEYDCYCNQSDYEHLMKLIDE